MNTLKKPASEETIPQLIIVDGGSEQLAFDERDIDQMQTILAQFSENKLMDDKWQLRIASSKRQASVLLPALSREIDAVLIRALVLQMLSFASASSSIGRAVKDAVWILSFFHDHHLHIENCRTAVVDLIIKELDRAADLSLMQKNSIMTTLGAMVELCEGFGLIAGTGIVDCSYRWKEPQLPKRAPDGCIIERLDSYFFDPIIDIPLQYRTVYMLLRLISNRISEVLFMPIDCLIYPDIDTYSISIPTQKATPYHVPEYKQYPKKLSGIEEGLLHRCLCELQQYAESQQNHLPCQHQNLLFVSPTGNTIVTTSDVNDYFKDICVKYLIKDSSGNPAIITTHDLRHTAVVERFKYGVISPYQTMRESNHSSLSQTLGYSYASVHDETEKLTEISEEVLSNFLLLPASGEVKPRELATKKFLALKEDPNTRLLLDGSICLNRSCVPSFEACSDCEDFHVDPMYQEALESYIALLSDRSQMLRSKGGNLDTIAFIEHQVEVYTKMLNKIKRCAESAKRKAG